MATLDISNGKNGLLPTHDFDVTNHLSPHFLKAMSSNFVNVTSPEHFKELLSQDLNRVSCLNFWASWAEPCAEFNKIVEKEAKDFEKVLFLNVSATSGSP